MFVRNPRHRPTKPRPAPLPAAYNKHGVPLDHRTLNMAAGKPPRA